MLISREIHRLGFHTLPKWFLKMHSERCSRLQVRMSTAIKFIKTQLPEKSLYSLGRMLSSNFTSQSYDLYVLGQANQVFVYL